MMRILLPILFFLFACSQEGAEHVGGVAEEDCCEPLKGGVDPAALSDESLFLLDHAFEDQHAESRRLVDLAGKPVVLAMIFTHCEYACPAILQDLHKLEEAMSEAERDATQWVLVSFDVERDVPEVLAAYAEREQLDPARWTLLHGDEDAVRELAALLGVRYKPMPAGGFSHSNRISLLNAKGELAAHIDGVNVNVAPLVEARRRMDVQG